MTPIHSNISPDDAPSPPGPTVYIVYVENKANGKKTNYKVRAHSKSEAIAAVSRNLRNKNKRIVAVS